MPTYMIFTREGAVQDEAAMAEYSRRNYDNAASFVNDFQFKPLVVYGALETLEGPAPDGVVILQFPNKTLAKAWYNSPAYQEALPYRLKGANYRAIIVEGL